MPAVLQPKVCTLYLIVWYLHIVFYSNIYIKHYTSECMINGTVCYGGWVWVINFFIYLYIGCSIMSRPPEVADNDYLMVWNRPTTCPLQLLYAHFARSTMSTWSWSSVATLEAFMLGDWYVESGRQKHNASIADITSCGWNVIDGILSIDLDSDENQAAVNARILLVRKRCKCKIGWATGRCGCQKKGQSCSEGCTCLHCSNLPNTSGKENKTVQNNADLEMEENRGQPQTSDGDNKTQHFLELLLAATSDSESESVGETDESNSDNDILSD